MRSWLFIPSIYEKYYKNLDNIDSDVKVLDFEDSVPQNKLKEAKKTFKKNSKFFVKSIIYARIPHSFINIKDITLLIDNGCKGIVIPKIHKLSTISKLDKILNTINRKIKIVLLIETAYSLVYLKEILSKSNKIIAIMFGHEDYLLDIESEESDDEINLNYARSHIVALAYSKKITPIDSPFLQIKNDKCLKKYIARSKLFGFKGMITLTPNQSKIANLNFLPSKKEYLKSVELISLNNEIQNNKLTNYSKGRFIGPPLLKKALINVELYERFNNKK